MSIIKLGFLVSGCGTNMQAIFDACKEQTLLAKPVVVISNNSQSGALLRARNENISNYHISTYTHPDFEQVDATICRLFVDYQVNWVILAGYMKRLGPKTLATFQKRILNIHPSLLPKYGGKGMYGRYVHEAVLNAGDKETGITVHLVDGDYDTGPIVAQTQVPVLQTDTVDTLAQRVLEQEHIFYVKTLKRIFLEEIKLS